MTPDVLPDVLRAVRLTGAVFFDFKLAPPWVAEAPASQEIADRVMPGAERVIEYHLVASGQAWGHAVGDEPLRLGEGDLLIFPQGDPHVLSSAPGMRAKPDLTLFRRSSSALPFVHELGNQGQDDKSRIICGFLGCDERPFNPLLAALPRVIHLPAARHDPMNWSLASLLDVAARESGRGQPGTENVLARLSELLFVEAIRRYLLALPDTERGWLAGLRDPVVGRALAAIHAAPRDEWTVESLGRTVGASRTALAARFTEMVGHPPMQYVTLWRMQLASRLLRSGQQVAEVADAVGYASEAAFSRTFKKLMGVPPAQWKRERSHDREAHRTQVAVAGRASSLA